MNEQQLTTKRVKRRILAEKIARDPSKVADLLVSLMSDLDAMRSPKFDDLLDSGAEEDGVEKAFGSFPQWEEIDGHVYVSWPNLDIMRERIRELTK